MLGGAAAGSGAEVRKPHALSLLLRPRYHSTAIQTAITARPIRNIRTAARWTQAISGTARPRNAPATQSLHDQRLTPAVKTELQREGKKVGWVTSVVFSPKRGQQVALGYVHRDHLAAGTVLDVAGGGSATVTSLPF